MLKRLRRNIKQSFQQRYRVTQVRNTGFWFVDIPRTSSSSIKAELGRTFGPAYAKTNLIEPEHASKQLFEDHTPAVTMRSLLGQASWDAIYTFTFVRNPYDRVASLYHYLRKRNEIPCEWQFPEFVERLVTSTIDTPHFQFHGLRCSASDYILDTDGTVLVDDIFAYERRADGIQEISRKLGVPDFGRLHIQSAAPEGYDYRSIYDGPTQELVSRHFSKDLKLFNYDY